jgi:4-alpha-glucanotransferase
LPPETIPEELAALAESYGVATSYLDQQDRPRPVPAESVRAVLDAMGADARDERGRRRFPPSVVVRSDDATTLPGRSLGSAVVATEDGRELPVSVTTDELRLPAGLPTGYHRLVAGEHEAHLVVAPPRCPVPDRRAWGWMLQLYALRSQASWGIGEFADLAELARFSGADLGAGFIVTNPLHAATPVLPQQPSPYFPSSRRFLNPLYLRIENVAGADALPNLAALAQAGRQLTHGDRIDRDAIFRLKHEALEALFADRRTDDGAGAFKRYRSEQGQGLEDFATFCALAERHGGSYHDWPAPLRHPRNGEVSAARDELRARVDYHAWLQWLCDEQLATAQAAATGAGMPLGLIGDLAVGVDAGGADAWALQDELAHGVTVGAPPDLFNQQGQDWQLPPLLPQRLADTGYAVFRDLLGALLRHTGGVRIDHVLGLFRLFWIPADARPADGTYVRYPADALLGVLALEADRAGAVVVGEDLGTVEEGVRERLHDRGVFSSRVLYFERTEDDESSLPAAGYPRLALASVTTHDLPTAAGYWRGEWLRLQVELGLLGSGTSEEAEAERTAEERAELTRLLRDEGLIGDDPSEEELVAAMHAFLARTPCLLVAAALGDAVGDPRQPNLPGTTDAYPNWRLPLATPTSEGPQPLLLEQLRAHPGLTRMARVLGATPAE